MLNLQFKNPVFQPGLNVTVRRGDKWFRTYETFYNRAEILKVNLTDENNNTIIENTEVEFVKIINFLDIPKTWLELEHDPRCCTLRGLYRAMTEAYGNFDVDELVSVIFFVTK